MIGASNQSQEHQRQLLNTSQPQHQHQHLVNHRTSNANQPPNPDDDFQDDHGMRVGDNYQAEIPQFIAYAPAPEYYEDEKAIRVWSPYNRIPDHILDEFINKAKEKYYYNVEQALGMLCWHRFDLDRAYTDLPNFVPFPNEWSVEDKVLFEQAFQFHEKQFAKIRQMLPDKSMANLINYYYSWKKTRVRASLMERQTRRFTARNKADGSSGDEEAEDENEANDSNKGVKSNDQNDEQKEQFETKEVDEPDINCCICSKQIRLDGQNLGAIIDGVVDNFCSKCYIDWKACGKKVVTEQELGDCFYHPTGEPKRILFSYQDVLSLVQGAPEAGDIMLKHLDEQVLNVKRDIQIRKQTLSQINEKIQPIADQIAELNIEEFSDILPEYKPSPSWSTEETQLLIQGLRRYGANFNTISEVICTKSPDIIAKYYVNNKDKLKLGLLVDEFERTKLAATIPHDLAQKESQQQPAKAILEEQKASRVQ